MKQSGMQIADCEHYAKRNLKCMASMLQTLHKQSKSKPNGLETTAQRTFGMSGVECRNGDGMNSRVRFIPQSAAAATTSTFMCHVRRIRCAGMDARAEERSIAGVSPGPSECAFATEHVCVHSRHSEQSLRTVVVL